MHVSFSLKISLHDFNDDLYIQDNKCFSFYKNEIKLAKNIFAFYFICHCTSLPV